MYMRNNKRRNVSTHAQVNFSQRRVRFRVGEEMNFELIVWGINRKNPAAVCTEIKTPEPKVLCSNQQTLVKLDDERVQSKSLTMSSPNII